MFVALKPMTESSRLGPPIQHAPGDVLERWAEWPYRVRVALLHAEMAEEREDFVALPVVPDVDVTPAQQIVLDAHPCPQCDRTDFASASALKRHITRKHT